MKTLQEQLSELKLERRAEIDAVNDCYNEKEAKLKEEYAKERKEKANNAFLSALDETTTMFKDGKMTSNDVVCHLRDVMGDFKDVYDIENKKEEVGVAVPSVFANLPSVTRFLRRAHFTSPDINSLLKRSSLSDDEKEEILSAVEVARKLSIEVKDINGKATAVIDVADAFDDKFHKEFEIKSV